jgi:hypothetical protein
MTTTVTNKPVPVATRAHGHGLPAIYAVRAQHDVGHRHASGLRACSLCSRNAFRSSTNFVSFVGSFSLITKGRVDASLDLLMPWPPSWQLDLEA